MIAINFIKTNNQNKVKKKTGRERERDWIHYKCFIFREHEKLIKNLQFKNKTWKLI